jgi:hypothetical protein
MEERWPFVLVQGARCRYDRPRNWTGGTPPHQVRLKAPIARPFPFTLDVHLEENGAGTKARQHFEADLNPFIKMMVESPLKNLFDHIADKMVAIHAACLIFPRSAVTPVAWRPRFKDHDAPKAKLTRPRCGRRADLPLPAPLSRAFRLMLVLLFITSSLSLVFPFLLGKLLDAARSRLLERTASGPWQHRLHSETARGVHCKALFGFSVSNCRATSRSMRWQVCASIPTSIW